MSNEEIIYGLVEKHFSLSEKCLSIFKDHLLENKSDRFLRSLVGNDLRAKYELSKDIMKKYDDGWELFKKLNTFIEYKKLTYENFIDGKTNSGEKLFKQAIKFYTKEKKAFSKDIIGNEIECSEVVIESFLKSFSEQVGALRLPKSKMYLVVSLNFADWFLCSTAEKWTSCLNLESNYAEAYWSGLPGTIVDPNRIMLYLTDGNKKNYLGIETDRFVGRCWAMVDKDNSLNINKFYPIDSMNIEIVKNCSGINTKLVDNTFRTKTDFIPLRNKKDYTVFIYIDKGKLVHSNGDLFSIVGSDTRGGMFGYDIENKPCDGTIINYSGGLHGLIAEKQKLEDHYTPLYICDGCGMALTEDEIHYGFGDAVYCSDCFYEHYFYCDYCGEVEEVNNGYVVHDKYHNEVYVCEDCFNKHATICEKCGEAYYDNATHEC